MLMSQTKPTARQIQVLKHIASLGGSASGLDVMVGPPDEQGELIAAGWVLESPCAAGGYNLVLTDSGLAAATMARA